MKFGPAPVAETEGAILAHAIAAGATTLKKGHVIGAEDIAAIRGEGLAEIVVARLEPGDIGEDAAAGEIAAALGGTHVDVEAAATGRANLFAATPGVLIIDRAGIDALNAIDPGLTVATLPEFATAEAGRMVATVKIIPFALPRNVIEAGVELIRQRGGLIRIAPFRLARVGVVSTLLPGLKASTVAKTLKVMDDRLAPMGARVVGERRVPHRTDAIAAAVRELIERDGAELVVVFGASAIVDPDDVIPAGIRAAGGIVTHFGMPVDPGNLLLLGEIDRRPVLGAPGCARSPRENGFDWVLSRLIAEVPVTEADIRGFGVGGLLMDIVSRPRPREVPAEVSEKSERKIAALVLAAGRSSRMGGPNKLLATLDDKPLVAHVVDAALVSRTTSVTVVTGHMADRVSDAVAGRDVAIVHNPDFAEGMSTSLKVGLAAVPEEAEAVIVLLADMPGVTAAMIDALIEAYEPQRGALIVVPTADGRRGNPVLWSRRFFAELASITGDMGGRNVLQGYPEAVTEVELGSAVAIDLDTPDAIRDAGATLNA
jgi:molybdenum cofactor cytidylyltransferase